MPPSHAVAAWMIEHAAMILNIRIRGGDGKPLDSSIGRTLRDNTGVVVTNGHVHDEVVAAVKQVLGREG